MAAPKWFDYATYKINKLAQLQQLDSSWNQTKMEEAFNKAGFTGTDGYYQHFQKYGHTEDVSPNEFFDAQYYYKAKALQFYTSEAGGSIAKETVLAQLETYADRVKGLINDAGMDAWTHYIKYGTAEGINPSNSFDTSAYMEAKLTAMKTQDPNYTMEDLTAAFKKANLNALEHAMQYAGNGNTYEAADAVAIGKDVPAAYAVPEDEQIAENTTTEFMFTNQVDRLVGTTADDTFTGTIGNVIAADSVDGKTGTDTVEIWGDTLSDGTDNIEAFSLPKMTNVENLVFHNVGVAAANTRDLSGVAIQNFGIDNGQIANDRMLTIKSAADQSITLTNVKAAGTSAGDTGITLDGTTSVTVDGFVADTKAHFATLDVKSSSATDFTVTAANNASTFTLANGGEKVTTLTLGEGDAALTVAAAAAMADKLTTVDASAHTADFSLDMSEAAGVANMGKFTFTGAKGNDTLTLNTTQLENVKGAQLDGGDGSEDTIAVAAATAASMSAGLVKQLSAIKNFEALQLNMGASAAWTISDAGALKNFDGITFKAGVNSASFEVSKGVEGVKTWTLDLSDHTADKVSMTATKAGASMNLDIKGGTAASDVATSLTLSGIKTVNMNVTKDDVKITKLVQEGADLTLKLTGDGSDFETVVNGSAGSGVTSQFALDGSGFDGNITLELITQKAGTLTGGSGSDSLTVTSKLAKASAGQITVSLAGGDGADEMFMVGNATGASGKLNFTTFSIEGYTKGEDKYHFGSATGAAITKFTDLGAVKSFAEVKAASGANVAFTLDGTLYLVHAAKAIATGGTAFNDGNATVVEVAGVSSLDDITAGDFYA